VWLADGTSLFDHIALEGFTLLHLDHRADVGAFVTAAADRHVPLAVVAPEGEGLLELYGAGLVLVRPDHYVAWRGQLEPADPGAVLDLVRGAGTRAPARDSDSAQTAVAT